MTRGHALHECLRYAIIWVALWMSAFGMTESFHREQLQEVYRLGETDATSDFQEPPAEGSLDAADPKSPAPSSAPANPNPPPAATEAQNQQGLVVEGTPPPPAEGGDSASGELLKKPPPPAPPPPIAAVAPAPPAPDAEYHAYADFHIKTREADQQTMDANHAASLDHGSTDPGNRFVAAQGSGAGPDPVQTPENQASADIDKTAPPATQPDPDAPPPPDPSTQRAWNHATGVAYTGDRNAPPETMAPTDGRVPVVHVDPNNKQHPYVNTREFPYPPADPDPKATQAYIWNTSLAHEADTWKPVYDGMPDPHTPLDSDVNLNGANGLVHYTPAYKDPEGRDAASEPLVDPERSSYPGMRQYVAPALKADKAEPVKPSVPASVIANITKETQEWLTQQEKDIDDNPMNDGSVKWKEVAAKSKEDRAKMAQGRTKERLKKWPKEQLQKQRDVRERKKKASILEDIKARSQFERDEKVNVTKVERAAKALNQHITAELTTKERAKKPSEQVQKDMDRAAGSAKIKEAEEKYKEYDLVQEAAEKAEIKREADEEKERQAKHNQLEQEAAPNQTLAEAMGEEQKMFMDTLAKDAYLASLKDHKAASHAANQEQNIAISLEENAQAALLPTLKPGALAVN